MLHKAFFVLLILQMAFVTDPLAAREPNTGEQISASGDLLEFVVQSIVSNREKLGAYSMALTEKQVPIREDLDSLPEKVETELPGGGGTLTVHTAKTPTTRTSYVLVKKGFVEMQLNDADSKLGSTWQYDAGLWYQYLPSRRVVCIRKPNQLPDTGLLNPDQLASNKFGRSIEEFLRESDIVQTKTIDNSEYGDQSIELTLAGPDNKQITKLIFGSDSRFLPVRSVLLAASDDSTEILSKSFEYQLAEPRDALILKTATYSYDLNPEIDPKHVPMVFLGERVFSVDQYELVEDGDVDQRRLALGEGWKTQDLTKVTLQPDVVDVRVGAVKTSNSRSLILALNVVAIIVLVVWYRRRSVRS